MDDWTSARLPYGLSSAHRNLRTGGKGVAIPFGQQTRQQISTLKELSQLPIATPAIKNVPSLRPSQPSSKHHKKHRREADQDTMGYVRNVRKINMGAASGKEKRGRTPKSAPAPQSSVRKKNKQNTESSKQSRPTSKALEPGTRMGAAADMPIEIMSDDEVSAVRKRFDETSMYTPSSSIAGGSSSSSNLSRFRYEDRTPSSIRSSSSIYSPSGSIRSPVFVLRRSDSAPSSQLPIRASTNQGHGPSKLTSNVPRSTSLDATYGFEDMVPGLACRKTTGHSTRKLAKRPRREHISSPSPASRTKVRSIGSKRGIMHDSSRRETERMMKSPPLLSRSRTAPVTMHNSPSTRSIATPDSPRRKVASPKAFAMPNESQFPRADSPDDKAELTLAGIIDFNTRSKVAQLMAVAPAFSIRELYDLLRDCKGQFAPAKSRVLGASEACHSAPVSIQDADEDEIMVKIDPNDSFLDWDQDEPEDTHHVPLRPPPGKSRSRNNRDEYTPNPPSQPTHATRPGRPASRHTARPTVQVQSSTGLATRKPSSPSKANSRHRETSFDREFIAPDNEEPERELDATDDNLSDASDTTSSSHSNSDSDKEPVTYRDALDLDIDMQPKYAFNSELLYLRKKGLGAFI
ncbi:hypothetical protein NX059_002872 [Plenodomus lindquistii]|nr:hypothetical protein NX059_002872 [Plenodomus lindquistii]